MMSALIYNIIMFYELEKTFGCLVVSQALKRLELLHYVVLFGLS